MGEHYAHSLPGAPVSQWQPLDVHLNQVAQRAAQFAESFQSSDWAWNAGLLHDIGKAADEFQAYLRRENHIDDSEYDETGQGRVNHSSAGAALAEERFNRDSIPLGRTLAYIIAGHHAGLPDYYTGDGGRGALLARMEEGRANLSRIVSRASELIADQRPLTALPKFVKKDNFHFWVRMVFSCLVDADYLDTEAFMQPEAAKNRTNEVPLGQLKAALDAHMEKLAANSNDTVVNRARQEILAACRNAAKAESGLFSLTVPTGGGKTLAAMTFALDHAMLHGKRRVIYVIPYTSIIEQTAATLEGIFGPEKVVEHHSNLAPEKETIRTRLASENWDASVVVTTNVQFFESLFSARPSRCRKLHNLVDSVIILDEAQLVPPNLLEPCVAAINELAANYGASIVLSTATQPALPKLRTVKEIIPESLNLYSRLQRTQIDIPQLMDQRTSWEELAARLIDHEQVLCIVNTRRDCHDLFRLMPKGTIHLSALMCGEHRSKVIATIKVMLANREPLRVISTQLVEAGVDIDFPVVYRALAGLDSIAQAAGRCNREGTLPGKGDVFVFVPEKAAPPGLLHKGESTTREMSTLPDFDAQTPESFARYFELFYNKLNDTGGAVLKDLSPSDPKLIDVAFRSTGDAFRLIDDRDQRPVLVRYGNNDALLNELRFAGPRRDLMRKLQRYTVNLRTRILDSMLRDGLVEEIFTGFFAQSALSIYSDEIGLDIFAKGLSIDDITGV